MRSLASDAPPPFEFHATLTELHDGLETLHHSVEMLRASSGRPPDDRNLILFESALAEIGANSLVHGLVPGSPGPMVEFELRLDGGTAVASLIDRGPPLHNQLSRAMPAPTREAGRGIAIARKVLDRLAYKREGEVNTWRLVKRL